MALIGLQTFTVSSFEFRQNMKMQTIPASRRWGQFSTSSLGTMLQSYHKLQPSPKQFPSLDALEFIWSALPRKAIENAVKGFLKRPQAYVCQLTVEFW